jgi:hypothetical protein
VFVGGFSRVLDLKKIDIDEIDNFSISNDGSMLVIYATYMLGVA